MFGVDMGRLQRRDIYYFVAMSLLSFHVLKTFAFCFSVFFKEDLSPQGIFLFFFNGA